MKPATIAAVLGFCTFQLIAQFEPLQSTLGVFTFWQRVVVVGSWCALLSAMSVLGGRMIARRYGWPAEVGIILIGVAAALVHFPSGRFRPPPDIPHEYTIGVIEMAACWLPAALIAHWLTPNKSLERTREG